LPQTADSRADGFGHARNFQYRLMMRQRPNVKKSLPAAGSWTREMHSRVHLHPELQAAIGERAPVFVMNPYYSGVGIARSLHGLGVRVFALCSEQNIPGMRSRYFHGVYPVPNGRDEPVQFCERLLTIAKDHRQKAVLFPTRDFDVLLLDRHRERLAQAYLLPQPGESAIARMMDKLELAAVAGRLGIATPTTASCMSAADIEQQARALRFPVIVKPRFAHQWRHRGLWERVGAQKAFIVESPGDLHELYRRLAGVNQEVLLQEYVPGVDTDIVVCCCYVGRSGALLGHFTARKLRQSPPLVGTGSVVEAIDVPELIAPSIDLLRAFAYSGIAEIEYKYDKATNTYFLIEINPRHWDQHELGNLVGVNITWLAYADMVGQKPLGSKPLYVPGVKYKWVAEPELALDVARNLAMGMKRLSAETNGSPERGGGLKRTYADLRNLLKGRKIYAVSRLKDPVPGIMMVIELIKDAVKALRARLGRKSQTEDSRRPRAP
jgi:predicted ATP-grasp superfamily ATP-dependent carboligase